jgi:mono/diheme cytochrome c family protein
MDSKTNLNLNRWFITGLVMIMASIHFSVNANVQPKVESGKKLYGKYCKKCHGRKGKGVFGIPPLTDPKWVNTDETIVTVISNGLKGEIEVNGKTYFKEMEAIRGLSEMEIAKIINHIRGNFIGSNDTILPERVSQIRGNLEE